MRKQQMSLARPGRHSKGRAHPRELPPAIGNVRSYSWPPFTFQTLVVIAALVSLTACGVQPGSSEVEIAQAPATAALPDAATPAPTTTSTPISVQIDRAAPTQTPVQSEQAEDVSDGDDAGNRAQATATQPAGNTFPVAVSGESLKGLCKYSGNRGSHSTVIHTKSYREVDGRFEIVSEGTQINTIDAMGNVHWIIVEEDGAELDLFLYVDGVSYNRVSEDEWQVEEKPDFWRGLLPDPEDTPGPTGGAGAPGEGGGSGPGEGSEGTPGPVGQVTETPEPLGADTICGRAVEKLTDFMDHGMETLNGIEVRHVSATVKLLPSLPYRETMDLWVDKEGTLVQSSSTKAQDAMSGFPAKRNEATSTFRERDPTVLITVPEGVPKLGE